MTPIDQAREHLKEPAPASRMIGALMAAFFCAVSALFMAGSILFGQLG
jgi:hypothetical protein